jgi:hypothetical protein
MKSLPAFLVSGLLAVSSLVGAEAVSTSRLADPRGGRVGWARLMTPDRQSGMHSDRDPGLASFIASQTSLNLDSNWQQIEANDLTKLCAFPFLYTKGLDTVSNARDLKNLQEYFQRGGFICIDPCVSGWNSAMTETFLRKHREWFARVIPGSTLRELPDSHAVFHCYFSVGVDDLFTPGMISHGAVKPPHIGLQGVFLEDRLIAVIFISGLECGWPQDPQRQPGCMKMLVNTYVYAMTR